MYASLLPDRFDPDSQIQRRQGLPEDSARWLFQQLILALDYCHKVPTRTVCLSQLLSWTGHLGPCQHSLNGIAARR